MEHKDFLTTRFCQVIFSSGERIEHHFESYEKAHESMMEDYHEELMSVLEDPDCRIASFNETSFIVQHKDWTTTQYIVEKKILCRRRDFVVLQLSPQKAPKGLFRRSFDTLNEQPKAENYYRAYTSEIVWESDAPDKDVLEEIFDICQSCKHKHYHGYPMDIADIVVLDGKAYYCDSRDWIELPESEAFSKIL